jgi:hypothetical protein
MEPEHRDCVEIEIQVGQLTRLVDSLQRILDTEPELSSAQRERLQRRISEHEATLSRLQDELRRCRSEITIEGVEFTQGTQYFCFNGQGSGFAPDNSVPLIAQRSAVLRVYVGSKRARDLQPPHQLPFFVNGRVTVDRIHPNGSIGRIATLTPINGPLPARAAAAIDRGNPNHTLNFRLSAADCQGTLRFTVLVFEQDPVVAPVAASAAKHASFSLQIHRRCEPVPAFRVRAFLVHYTGGGMDLPVPSGLDFAKTLAYILKTYPIGRLEFGDCTQLDFNMNLATPGGGCGPGFEGAGGLLKVLARLQEASDDTAIYIALIPSGAQTSVGGCGNTGVAAAKDGDGDTLAQEVGHALDRKHAPSGGAGGPDPNYPAYQGYPSGSIGEFGFDTATSTVFDPASTYDFMGYDGPRWVSPYTYLGLRDEMVERFGSAAAAGPVDPSRAQTLFLAFRVHRDGVVEMAPGFHLSVQRRARAGSSKSEVCVELLDRDGVVLVFQRCTQRDRHYDEYGPYTDFAEALPWVDGTAAIRFLRRGEVLHVHKVEASAPVLEISPSALQCRAERVALTWKGHHPEEDLTYIVRHSADGGKTWRVVAANLSEPACRLNANSLPGGERCVLEIVASSGVRTTVARTEPFAISRKPRTAFILMPGPAGGSLPKGSEIVLQGGAHSPDFGLAGMEETCWTSSVDGLLGCGFELVARDLSTGRHTLTLSAPNGMGGEATSSVSVLVDGSTDKPQALR